MARKFFFTMMAAFAELERDIIHERTMAGLAAARARGRNGGRPTVMDADKLAAARARRERGESPTQIDVTREASPVSPTQDAQTVTAGGDVPHQPIALFGLTWSVPGKLLSMLISDPPRSYAEITAALAIPVGSIGPQRGRCLERLRKSEILIAFGEGEIIAPGGEPSD